MGILTGAPGNTGDAPVAGLVYISIAVITGIAVSVLSVVNFIFYCKAGDRGANRFGPPV